MEAIKFNQKVWSFFQAELSDPENPLPKQLREDILNLSIFIDKRLFDVMAFPDPNKLNIVIDINFNIAAGCALNRKILNKLYDGRGIAPFFQIPYNFLDMFITPCFQLQRYLGLAQGKGFRAPVMVDQEYVGLHGRDVGRE